MGILDMYMKQYEEDKKNENFDLPENCMNESEIDKEEYKKALEKMRKDMDNYKENMTVSVSDTSELDFEVPDTTDTVCFEEENNTNKNIEMCETKEPTITKEDQLPYSNEEVRCYVRRAYCPDCNREIISRGPAMYNPYTFESISTHKCECGKILYLQYSYPRIVYVGNDGNEIKAFNI